MKLASSIARFGRLTASARRSDGVALVVTLILLAVITFMAIAFLVISRSERGAVATTTDLTIARLAADAGIEQAKADILVPIMAQDNPFLVGLMVSTNFINDYGFVPGLRNPTNVNFDYVAAGGPLNAAQQQENMANLLFRPRVPVFMRDSRTGNRVFQYYLDVNRNGRPEPSGLLVVTNDLDQPVLDNNGVPIVQQFQGDPHWIGGLEFPDRPHSGTNRFTWRFAYIIAPVGQTLDLNYMHNTARQPTTPPAQDRFARNQGVGTWEMNLGAFFTDLNTNMWFVPQALGGLGSRYIYNPNFDQENSGAGFADATALLRYRYNTATLWNPGQLFQNPLRLLADGFDTFTGGAPDPITSTRGALSSPGTYNIDPDMAMNRGGMPWPGSYNPNLFYSPFDLFERSKTAIGVTGTGLTDRLEEAGRRNSSYNRYTFHRLLEQLGTESPPEEDRINVNYRNVQNGRIVPNAQTNFVTWAPTDFFTNAAVRLLDNAGFTFGITNIQIWPTNNYTPSVHRALQLAANIYDATTNHTHPTVFRPIFEKRPIGGGTNGVFIAGYRRVQDANALGNGAGTADGLVFRDLLSSTDRDALVENDAVWGVPFVVGAKKGLPNFNQFATDTRLQITRKLEFKRAGANNSPIVRTNQLFTFSLVNSLGLEAWNSYLHTNWGNLVINARVDVFPSITNRFGQLLYPGAVTTNVLSLATNINIPQGQWRGAPGTIRTAASDRSVTNIFMNTFVLMPESRFSDRFQQFIAPARDAFDEQNGTFPLPDWTLNLRTRIYYSLVDINTGEVLDFVTLTDFRSVLLADLLQRNDDTRMPETTCGVIWNASGAPGAMWCTNRPGLVLDERVPTFGVLNQIAAGLSEVTATQWPERTNISKINFFRAQFDGYSPLAGGKSGYSRTNTFYAPYSPTREVHMFIKWQANDPLVHYTPGDLADQGDTVDWDFKTNTSQIVNLGKVNSRYEPYIRGVDSSSPTAHEPGLKDPLVWRSDSWDFPTNKFPNIGWIGRVHRGTPWQTVYLKSKLVDTNMWVKWAGSEVKFYNQGQVKFSLVASNTMVNDSIMSMPFQDWAVPEIFTAAVVDNATRGQLSINQPNLAAWSAVLSGVPVLSNLTTGARGELLAATNIQPAAVDGAVQLIVDGINRARDKMPGGVFRRLGEICSVPELTLNSPYIQNPGRRGDDRRDLVSDAVYERIPQQVMGLLRCESTPRFIVYSYGQALKPARESVLTSGPYTGMCTNYQVTAEVVTRAVIRVDGAPDKPEVIVENFNVLPQD